jgi:hypothetical protein
MLHADFLEVSSLSVHFFPVHMYKLTTDDICMLYLAATFVP